MGADARFKLLALLGLTAVMLLTGWLQGACAMPDVHAEARD